MSGIAVELSVEELQVVLKLKLHKLNKAAYYFYNESDGWKDLNSSRYNGAKKFFEDGLQALEVCRIFQNLIKEAEVGIGEER